MLTAAAASSLSAHAASRSELAAMGANRRVGHQKQDRVIAGINRALRVGYGEEPAGLVHLGTFDRARYRPGLLWPSVGRGSRSGRALAQQRLVDTLDDTRHFGE